MNLWPSHTETLVSALSKEEVLSYLTKVTRETNFLDQRTQHKKPILFNGIIGKNGFRVSKVVDKADSFLPVILGKIEMTPRGSIIFLKYKLFPGSLSFMIFWSLVLIAFSLFYFFLRSNFLYGSICIGLGVINYLVALYFFNRQVKNSRKVFYKIITFEMKD